MSATNAPVGVRVRLWRAAERAFADACAALNGTIVEFMSDDERTAFLAGYEQAEREYEDDESEWAQKLVRAKNERDAQARHANELADQLRRVEQQRDSAQAQLVELLPRDTDRPVDSSTAQERLAAHIELQRIDELLDQPYLKHGRRDRIAQLLNMAASAHEVAAQIAAVGVAGAVQWAVDAGAHGVHIYKTKHDALHDVPRWPGRVVCVVDPERVVPLASVEPVAWRDDEYDIYVGRMTGVCRTRKEAARDAKGTVSPYFLGLAQPAQERAE